MKSFFKALYIGQRTFIALGILSVLFVVGFFLTPLFAIAKAAAFGLVGLVVIDLFAIFRIKNGVHGSRVMAEKLSNGDENTIELYIENRYPFNINVTIIDELPFQFQKRDFEMQMEVGSQKVKVIDYYVRPTKRGEYEFGGLNVYVSSVLGLIKKRYVFGINQTAKVYPSYIQMRKYELLAISNKLIMPGIKKIRRVGHSLEFEHIKEYVLGDDYRAVNWKATGRKARLMVNHYQDERSQQVYSLIDMGRIMKMPFNSLSLLDYAINTSLVISNVAIKKEDKAGLLTFSNKISTLLPAEKKNDQMLKIMDVLYKQNSDFKESSFEQLYITIRRQITQRSLLLLFTNFETLQGLQRQLDYIKLLSRSHLVVVIFFENTELETLTHQKPKTTEDIYIKTIAEKFAYEKRLIVKELEKHGVYSILTPPEKLTINTVNRYLEFKSRGLI